MIILFYTGIFIADFKKRIMAVSLKRVDHQFDEKTPAKRIHLIPKWKQTNAEVNTNSLIMDIHHSMKEIDELLEASLKNRLNT